MKCPHDPTKLRGAPIGMYHCPECGEMVLAGVPHPGSPPNFVHIQESKWQEMKGRERPDEVHPCDNWNADQCMCKGACSCHWEQEK